MVFGFVRSFVVGTYFRRDATATNRARTTMSAQWFYPHIAVPAVDEAPSAKAGALDEAPSAKAGAPSDVAVAGSDSAEPKEDAVRDPSFR